MKIIEQTLVIKERKSMIKADHATDAIFQVFVKGRLQDRRTYFLDGQTVNFGFDCLVPGDLVQIFYLVP